MDASVSITAVFNHWILENPSDYYPLTWEGLDHLLNNAELELSQVAVGSCRTEQFNNCI